jgi:hypothetical protein
MTAIPEGMGVFGPSQVPKLVVCHFSVLAVDLVGILQILFPLGSEDYIPEKVYAVQIPLNVTVIVSAFGDCLALLLPERALW